jgi:hypothetical protein
MSVASGEGSRMPATLNHWCPSQIRWSGWTRSMPNCCAAAEPSTATGSRAVPALSHAPRAMPVLSTDSRFRLAARTCRPPLLPTGIIELR